MNLKTYSMMMAVATVLWLALAWLSPMRAHNVDLFGWLVGPAMYMLITTTAHMAAEAHKGGYAVTWPHGHSATATGGWAFEVPARGNYPTLAAVPLGGGNVLSVLIPGGRKAGWLITPRDQLKELNGQIWCNTSTRYVMAVDLPPHVLSILKTHHLYDDKGMVAWGLLPYSAEAKLNQDVEAIKADIEAALNDSNREVNVQRKRNDTYLNTIREQASLIESYNLQARQAEEPPPTFTERATKAMQGGDEV